MAAGSWAWKECTKLQETFQEGSDRRKSIKSFSLTEGNDSDPAGWEGLHLRSYSVGQWPPHLYPGKQRQLPCGEVSSGKWSAQPIVGLQYYCLTFYLPVRGESEALNIRAH